jgi:hypothetical protein
MLTAARAENILRNRAGDVLDQPRSAPASNFF